MKNPLTRLAAPGRLRGAVGLVTASVLCLSMIGCPSPTATLGKQVAVKGKITMDGQPAADVEVSFTRNDKGAPAEFRTHTVRTTATGEYAIEKIYPAKYTVMIYDRKAGGAVAGDAGDVATDAGPYAKYGVESTLVADVKEGQTEHKFDLTSK